MYLVLFHHYKLYIVYMSQTGCTATAEPPTFGAQSVTLGALPDSSLVHLVCVTIACPHTRSVISHNIVICNDCKIQAGLPHNHVIFNIYRLTNTKHLSPKSPKRKQKT